jgi:hypothetical protein
MPGNPVGPRPSEFFLLEDRAPNLGKFALFFIRVARNITKRRNKIRTVQAQNQNTAEFSERTNRLAEKLGVSLRDLGPKLEMSTAMLFGYRSGSNLISVKAWKKLEQAEIRAGLRPEDEPFVGRVSEEEQAPFGATDVLRRELRSILERMLTAAGDDPTRLGWLKVELEQKLAVARSWLSADEINRQAVDLAKKMTAERTKRLASESHATRRRTG